MTRCGVLLCVGLLGIGCKSSLNEPRTATVTSQLVIGFPQGNVASEGLGTAQLANILTLESLTLLGEDGRPIPRLAERWQWENDNLRLRVFLRPNVVFHDGTPLSARLAADVLERAIARPGNRARYLSLAHVTAVEADGPQQLVFELAQPSGQLPEDLSINLATGAQNAGTGPYRVVSRSESEWVLERFDRYYLGQPSIQRVVVKGFDTLRTAWTSLLRGDVDMVWEVPQEAVEFVQGQDVQVVSFPRWFQFLIAFNSQKSAFQSPAVRRALNLAVDRNALVERVLQGKGRPSTGPLWPNYWGYDASVTPYSFDPSQAHAILDGAGLPLLAATKDASRPPARLRFTCLVPANFSVWERVALEVQKDLYNVGVDMQFEVVPFEDFNRRVAEGEFDAALFEMISGPSPARSYIFWRSARELSGLNVFGYENPEAERLFNIVQASSNETAVRSAVGRLQRVLLQDPPALFIAWNERARAIRGDFVIPRQPGRDPVSALWQWTRNPSRQVASTQ